MITEQEYQELLNGFVDPQYKAIVQLQWTTGARISEILSINSDGIQDEGELIYKEVVFFLAKTNTETVIVSHEHLSHTWLDYKNAVEKTTYQNAKDVLSKANDLLQKT